MTKNAIGIDASLANQLIARLNSLLANTQVFYMNTRGLHWNIEGDKFFELHLKYEELYNDLNLKVDEIAERVLTLGGRPAHSFTEYFSLSSIKELSNVKDAVRGVDAVIESLGILISLEREILILSAEANDEGTNSMMSDYIRQQEKLVWMYSAFSRNA